MVEQHITLILNRVSTTCYSRIYSFTTASLSVSRPTHALYWNSHWRAFSIKKTGASSSLFNSVQCRSTDVWRYTAFHYVVINWSLRRGTFAYNEIKKPQLIERKCIYAGFGNLSSL